jgi:sugar O-acyltransferase (sialic acid O-acetyltransferase NeuD family)
MKMKRALVGNGGFASEVKASLRRNAMLCFVDDAYYIGEENTLPLSKFDPEEYELFITIGNPLARASMVSRLPKETKYFSIIDPFALLLNKGSIEIGEGSIVCANCLFTCNIKIGKHCHFNLATLIGHDVIIGDYFTSAPDVKIMGNNTIGDYVYFGTNASTKEKITVADGVIVGLNAGVVSNLTEAGTYVGTPARRIK